MLWAALLGALALAVWAAVNVGAARNGYIQMAFFHGYLELAAAALLWAELQATPSSSSTISSISCQSASRSSESPSQPGTSTTPSAASSA